MSLEMLLLVGGLVEGKSASVDRTHVRLLASVDAQVIKEVVPFSEDFPTVWIVTSK